MKIISASALAILALAATDVSAQLVYEPFEYGSSAVGQPFANQTGTPAWQGYTLPSSGQPWFTSATTATGTANSGDDTLFAGSLPTPLGLTPGAGNSAGSTVSDEHIINTAFTPTSVSGTGATVYASLLFTINDISNVVATNTTGAFVFGMGTTQYTGTQGGTPGVVGAALQVRRDQTDPSKFNIGLHPNSGAVQWDTTDAFAPGTPILLVFSYTFNSNSFSSSTDVQSMWVNPDPNSFGAATAPAPTKTWTGNGVNNALKTIFINRGANNPASPNAMQFDDIRVDTTWAQVTPPAGSTFTASSSTDWSNPGSWDAGGVPTGPARFAYLTGSTGGTLNLDSPQTLGTLTFKGPGAYSLSTTNSSTLTLNGDTGGASAINVQAAMDPVSADTPIPTSHSISVPITLATSTSVNVALSQTLTLSGNISDAGSQTLTKNGPGALILSGSNTYAGPTTVNAGTLAITSDASLGAIPSTPTLNLILVKGTGATGTTGLLRFDADASLSPNRIIELLQNGGGGPTLNTNSHDVTIAGQLTAGAGGANLTKTGMGTLTLTGDNSQSLLPGGGFLNALIINGGAINASQDVNLGQLTRAITLNGGTLQFGASFNPAARPFTIGASSGVIDTNGFDATIDGVISNSAGATTALTKTGAGTLTLTGANTLAGALRITGGSLILRPSAWTSVLSSTPGGAVINSGSLIFDYTGSSAPSITSLLASSYNSSNFTDPTQRLRTSNPNDPNHGLGYLDDGVSKLTLQYTWYGDANLDGTVNADDFALIDKSVAMTLPPSWLTGDFNYDGSVNSSDYLAMDTSFGKIQGVLSPEFLASRQAEFGETYVQQLIAAVPEPASPLACLLAASLLPRRRRHM